MVRATSKTLVFLGLVLVVLVSNAHAVAPTLLWGGGSGNWNSANWWDGSNFVNWIPGAYADFGNASNGATISVNGEVKAAGIYNQNNGAGATLTITGDPLTMSPDGSKVMEGWWVFDIRDKMETGNTRYLNINCQLVEDPSLPPGTVGVNHYAHSREYLTLTPPAKNVWSGKIFQSSGWLRWGNANGIPDMGWIQCGYRGVYTQSQVVDVRKLTGASNSFIDFSSPTLFGVQMRIFQDDNASFAAPVNGNYNGVFAKHRPGTYTISSNNSAKFWKGTYIFGGAVASVHNTGVPTANNGLMLGGTDGVYENLSAAPPVYGDGTNNPFRYGIKHLGGNSGLSQGVPGTLTYTPLGGVVVWGTIESLPGYMGVNQSHKDGSGLVFGSSTAQGLVDLTSAIDLNGKVREVFVYDNPAAAGDKAKMSGILSGAGASGLRKAGPGTLELSNVNNFSGDAIVRDGKLVVMAGASIGPGGVVQVGEPVSAAVNVRAASPLAPRTDTIFGTIDTFGAANVATTGLQTLDYAQLQENDRVLLMTQDNPAENGVWKVMSGAWEQLYGGGGGGAVGLQVKVLEGRSMWNYVFHGTQPDGYLAGQTIWHLDSLMHNPSLGGSGTIDRAVTLMAGAKLTPGESVGTLTTGDLTFPAGSSYNWEYLNAAGDLVRVYSATGTATLSIADSSATTINVSGSGAYPAVAKLFDFQALGGGFSDGQRLSWTVTGADNEHLRAAVMLNPDGSGSIALVPEPSALYLLAAVGLAALAFWRRRVA